MIKIRFYKRMPGLAITLLISTSWFYSAAAQGCGYGTSAQDCQHQQRDEAARRDSDYHHQQETQGGTDITYDPSPMPMERREMLWGALAIDKKKVLVNDKELKFIGVSSMKKTMKEAQKAAMDMCKSDGSKDCELVQTALNQCLSISIAAKDNGMAYFFAPTVQDAMTISQHKCNQAHKDCKVAHTACSNANL